MIEKLNAQQARSLLETFRQPAPAVGHIGDTELSWQGVFVSRKDFMEHPYVSGGYLVGNDENLVEIWIWWEDIDIMEDVTFSPGGYCFDAYITDVEEGWRDVVDVVKRHLEEIAWMVDAEQHNSDPKYLRNLIERAGISQRGAARRLGISDRSMRQYLADRATQTALDAPYTVQYALERLAYGVS